MNSLEFFRNLSSCRYDKNNHFESSKVFVKGKYEGFLFASIVSNIANLYDNSKNKLYIDAFESIDFNEKKIFKFIANTSVSPIFH